MITIRIILTADAGVLWLALLALLLMPLWVAATAWRNTTEDNRAKRLAAEAEKAQAQAQAQAEQGQRRGGTTA